MSARYLPKQKPRKRKTRRTTESTRFRAPRLKPEEIDYKDVAMLQRLTSAQGKLFSRKRTGLDAKRHLALKRARFLALMPYVT
ncbi:MAG TPA: 30S ribosomal protein S18 [Phycisphaerae bacterium]|nr:30S ribosomal protein S18 [Phycisphaerae bacterium]